MKKTVLALVLAGMAYNAMAADSVELKIKGTLVNGSCTPTLDKTEVNFGTIPAGSLDKTATNQLGSRNATLTITCDNAMVMGWTTTDGRVDSLQNLTVAKAGADDSDITAQTSEYGLGKAGDVKLGAFTLAATTTGVTADGTAGDLLEADNVGSSNQSVWVKSTTGVTQPTVRTFTVGTSGTTTPKAFKVGVFPLKITAAVQGTDTLALTDDANLDGLVTISLDYI